MTLRALVPSLSLVLAASASAAPARERPTPLEVFDANVARGGTFEPGELLVRAAPGTSRDALDAQAKALGCTALRSVGRRPLFVVACDRRAPVRDLVAAWSRVEGVRWVEAAFHDDQLEAVPDDLAELQWYHLNTGQTVDRVRGTPGADMSSTRAWDVSTAAPERKIAIIDVGVYPAHQDLANRIWVNPREVCGNGRDDDGNGYVDDCRGWDFGEADNDPSPLSLPAMRGDGSDCLNWHATYIAGLAAAEGDNGVGLAGTAWNVSLINIKRHIDATCRSTTTRTVEAVAYAVDQGADALGMSFSSTTYSAEFEDMLQEAELRGVITVMSAGNGGSNIDLDDDRWPNNYAIQEKLIVATTDNRDRLDPGSNFGPQKVHLAAPGTFVVSTAIDAPDAYGAGTGTSMSVGFVLGAVALTRTAFPMLSGADTRLSILEGSRAVRTLDCAVASRCVSSGKRLDLLGTLQAASQRFPANLSLTGLTVEEAGDGDRLLEPGETGRVRAIVANGGMGGAFAVSLSADLPNAPAGVALEGSPAQLGAIAPGSSAALPASGGVTVTVGSDCRAVSVSQPVVLRVEDALGRTAEATLDLALSCPDAPGPAPDAGPVEPGRDASAPSDDAGQAEDAGQTVADAGSSEPDPEENGGDELERSRSGCSASGTASDAALTWALLLLGALPLRRRR